MERCENKQIAGCGSRQGSVDTAKKEGKGRGGGDAKRSSKSVANKVPADVEGG